MKNVRYQRLLRIGKRGLQIAQAQPLPLELSAIAPLVVDAYQGFFGSFEELRASIEAEAGKELQLHAAFAKLRLEYDVARVALTAWDAAASLGQSGSNCRATEDLLEVARQARQALGDRQEPCAQLFLPVLVEALDCANQVWQEGVLIRARLQKIQTQCREQAKRLEAALVMLRRVVRVLYGSSSNEYQMLRLVHTNNEDAQPVENPVVLSANNTNSPKANAA